jgi:hypothetical protein
MGKDGYAGYVPAQLPMFTVVVSADWAGHHSKLKMAFFVLHNALAIGVCLAVVGLLIGMVTGRVYYIVFVSDFQSACAAMGTGSQSTSDGQLSSCSCIQYGHDGK